MSEFKKYHPIVNLIYFLFVIGFSCFFMHPICLFVSLVSGFSYSVMLRGKKIIKTNLTYMLPVILFMGIINPLFNHEGATIICYFANGNPLTFESIIYGVCAATMIVSVIFHFSCYNEIMTSDKFIYLFGKIIPAMSLIISMTLRFVPRFKTQMKIVTNAQRCMGRDVSGGKITDRIKNGCNIISIMITWSFENAIDTADSMKSRGYGIPGRTAFSIYKFDKRDKTFLVYIVFLGIYVFVGNLMGAVSFDYFPFIKSADVSIYGASVFAAYLLLCIFPIIIEVWEVKKWEILMSKN